MQLAHLGRADEEVGMAQVGQCALEQGAGPLVAREVVEDQAFSPRQNCRPWAGVA
jgi:hypothetical protein